MKEASDSLSNCCMCGKEIPNTTDWCSQECYDKWFENYPMYEWRVTRP